MSSPYEQMAEAAKAARSNWTARNNAAIKAFSTFYKKFRDYCQMPEGSLQIIPWEEKEQVFRRKAKEDFASIHGSMRRDEVNDEWGLGLYIQLNPLNHFPPLSIQFGLFLKQEDGKFIFRIGNAENRTIDPTNQTDWDAYFAAIVESMTEEFEKPFLPKPPTEDPPKTMVNQYGFVLDVAAKDEVSNN